MEQLNRRILGSLARVVQGHPANKDNNTRDGKNGVFVGELGKADLHGAQGLARNREMH